MHGFAIAFAAIRDAVSFIQSARPAEIVAAVIGLVFVWSGAEKIRRPTGAAVALVSFGLAPRVDRRLGWLAGALELSVAGAILWLPAREPLLIGTALLWLFVVLLIRALATGQNEPCHCFGESDQPIGPATIVRTATLAALATAAAWAAAGAPIPWSDRVLVIACGGALLSSMVLALAVPRVIASGRHTHVVSRLA